MNDIDQWFDDLRRPLGMCGGCGQSLLNWQPTKCTRCGILLCEQCAKKAPCCRTTLPIHEGKPTDPRLP